MEKSMAVWILVLFRALFGCLFCVISIQMVRWAEAELTIRRTRGENGMQEEILLGQIRFGWLSVARLFLLGASAWLSLPFVGHLGLEYRWQHVVAASLVFLLTLMDSAYVYLKWRERSRLLAMAREYRKKTQAEGGHVA